MTRYRFAWWWALGCVLVTLPLLAQTQQTGEEDDPIEVEIVEEEEETPAAAEPSPPPSAAALPPPQPQPSRSRWVAGAWCALRSSGDVHQPADPVADGPSRGEGGEDQEENNDESAAIEEIGCDIGAGMRLVGRCYSQGCVSLIGALGMRTVGFGIAWTVTSVGDRPVSVAIGYALPFDGEGIYIDVGALVIGATVSVGGGSRR